MRTQLNELSLVYQNSQQVDCIISISLICITQQWFDVNLLQKGWNFKIKYLRTYWGIRDWISNKNSIALVCVLQPRCNFMRSAWIDLNMEMIWCIAILKVKLQQHNWLNTTARISCNYIFWVVEVFMLLVARSSTAPAWIAFRVFDTLYIFVALCSQFRCIAPRTFWQIWSAICPTQPFIAACLCTTSAIYHALCNVRTLRAVAPITIWKKDINFTEYTCNIMVIRKINTNLTVYIGIQRIIRGKSLPIPGKTPAIIHEI